MTETTELKQATESVKTPLYGHTSEETSLLVPDYPYSFKLRCRIRYWLEQSKTKGFRFVSQTENPKNLRWNAPKKSTYAILAGNLYRDANGHVHWDGLGYSSGAKEIHAFLKNFPETVITNELASTCFAHRLSAMATSEGRATHSFNGVPQVPNEFDIQKAKDEVLLWNEIMAKVSPAFKKAQEEKA